MTAFLAITIGVLICVCVVGIIMGASAAIDHLAYHVAIGDLDLGDA